MAIVEVVDAGWATQLLQNLQQQCKGSARFCDCTLMLDNGTSFAVPACLLSAASPVLHQNIMETPASSGPYNIPFNTVGTETVDALLAYIYTGTVTCSSKVMEQLKRLACDLGMNQLVYFIEHVPKSEENAADVTGFGPVKIEKEENGVSFVPSLQKVHEDSKSVPQKFTLPSVWYPREWGCYRCDDKCRTRKMLREHLREEHGAKNSSSFGDNISLLSPVMNDKAVNVMSGISKNEEHDSDFGAVVASVSAITMTPEVSEVITVTSDASGVISFEESGDMPDQNDLPVSSPIVSPHSSAENVNSVLSEIDDSLRTYEPEKTELVRATKESACYHSRWICNRCDQNFKTRKLLEDHRRMDHKLGRRKSTRKVASGDPSTVCTRWKCAKCEKYFNTRKTLGDHKKICGQAVAKQTTKTSQDITVDNIETEDIADENRDVHVLGRNEADMTKSSFFLNMPISTVICETCGKKFRTRKLLSRHLKTHLVPTSDSKHGKYVCEAPDCSVTTLTYRDMFIHQKENHKDDEITYPIKCIKCSKEFAMQRNYEVHLKVHPKCDLCGQRFTQKAVYKEHLNLHRGVRPYVCDQCPRSYSSMTGLKAHAKVHYSEPEYKCKFCDRRFHFSKNRVSHEITHSDKKSFFCVYCGATFKRREAWKTHEKVHVVGSCHQCQLCHKSFTRKNLLRRHMWIHEGIKPFACSCGRGFRRKSHLQTHLNQNTDHVAMTDTSSGQTMMTIIENTVSAVT